MAARDTESGSGPGPEFSTSNITGRGPAPGLEDPSASRGDVDWRSSDTYRIREGSAEAKAKTQEIYRNLPPDIRAQLSAQAHRLTPATFAQRISFGSWVAARHLQYISHKYAVKWTQGGMRLIVSVPPRHGKALKHGTLVKVPGGYKPIEDLHPGDLVTGPSGNHTILATYPQGPTQLYRLTLSDGSTVECCRDHIWHVYHDSNPNPTNCTLEQIIAGAMQHTVYQIADCTKDLHTITSIEPTSTDEATCISIDADDGLFFVTHANIVTHNSELLSVYTPCWILDRDAGRRIIQCSYGAELSNEFSQRVRDIILEDKEEGYNQINATIRSDAKRADKFRTTEGVGGLVSAGVGGPITGRGANDLSIDDYMKNAKDSLSETLREDHWNWFTSTAMTRLEPNANVVILATRWNVDDIIGRVKEEAHRNWECIDLKAIAEDDDPLGRKPGEALWPERYDIDTLENIRLDLGTFWWRALYQQDPMASMSGLFDDAWLRAPMTLPPFSEMQLVRAWDLGASEGEGDYTVGVLLGVP